MFLHQIVDKVPSIAPTFGALFGSFSDSSFYTTTMLGIILTFLFVDFFDNAGTLVAVANQAGLMKDNKLPRAGKALIADSIASYQVQFLEHLQLHLMLSQLQG